MKRWLILTSIAFVLIVAGGCQRGRSNNGEVNTIALVMKTLNNPFFIDMQRGAEDAANRLGVSLVVQGAEREVDVEKQMQIIENLIQRQVTAVCVTPSGSKEIVPAIVKANAAEIPVLIIDTRVDEATLRGAGGVTAAFIGSDNFEGGRIAGAYMAEQLRGQGRVAILEGIPGHETGDARLQGFKKAIEEMPSMVVSASQTANWERDQGFNVFQNMLQSNPEINSLFACNDMMALGAVEAIAAAGRTGEIFIVGFDAVADAREAIRKGVMSGSVAQHPYEMGKLAIETAYRLLQGEEVPSYIPVQIELITKDKL